MTLVSGGEQFAGVHRQFDIQQYKEEGWTIGRGKDCDWILPDPKRFVSNKHVLLQSDPTGTHFILIDASTNGVFINGSNSPLGRGHQYELMPDDVLKIGPYEIKVALISAKNLPSSRAKKKSEEKSKEKPEEREKALPKNTKATPKVTGKANPKMTSKGTKSKPAPEQAVDQAAAMRVFWETLGIEPPDGLSTDELQHLMQTMATCLNQTLKGVRELLSSASSLSKEFSPDEAFLGAREKRSFLGRIDENKLNWDWSDIVKDPNGCAEWGLETFSDYIQYLKDHELALCVAIDAAIQSVIKQFDPQHLQATFDRMAKPGFFAHHNKAQYWDRFNLYFRRFKQENQGYQSLFNEQFADAYEKQMSRLAAIHGNWKRLLNKKKECVEEEDATPAG